ncbi:two-component sensor histidine kinase [Acrocarpospora phusangensis]|uniref:histidine kinase n=1 Tax=Acrocarpospora phusangensis TaxID=1070424 RepID=A0A919Q6J1_9ACTN|nr:HAMP domain-containing sensor histidine kinase [Acrocarpospora phusangensis]GIH23339.1 two-component sensor histidine kinase [Acrocarpospora phusangensis]
MATGTVVLFVCIAVSFLFLLYVAGKDTDRVEARATEAWNRVVPLIREGPLPSLLPDSQVEAIQVLDARGNVVASTQQLLGKPPMATFLSGNGDVRSAQVLCPPRGLVGCSTVVSYKVYQPDGIWPLYVAVPVIPWYGDATALLLAIGVSVLVTAGITGWVFRDLTKVVAPVNAMQAELAEITASRLDRRVPVPRKYGEIKFLAETVNDTLDRLEGAYQQLRRFTSDASHDLRSPISAMRVQLDQALMYPQDTDWPKMATSVLAGVDRLQAIVTDLLTLARLDARAPLSRNPTDLSMLVAAEVDRRTYRVELVKNLRRNVYVECDRLRITRVLVNLLDNAERHANSRITVSVRSEGCTAIMEVLDDGAGIAPEQREMVFERFTRLAASRERDSGGTGLGLPIAREIAEAHQGTLTIQDSERGARFVLSLPVYECAPVGAQTRSPSAGAGGRRGPTRRNWTIPDLGKGAT